MTLCKYCIANIVLLCYFLFIILQNFKINIDILGITSDKRKTNSDERNHLKFYARHKHIFLIGAISILLFILFLIITNFTFFIIFGHGARNTSG